MDKLFMFFLFIRTVQWHVLPCLSEVMLHSWVPGSYDDHVDLLFTILLLFLSHYHHLSASWDYASTKALNLNS